MHAEVCNQPTALLKDYSIYRLFKIALLPRRVRQLLAVLIAMSCDERGTVYCETTAIRSIDFNTLLKDYEPTVCAMVLFEKLKPQIYGCANGSQPLRRAERLLHWMGSCLSSDEEISPLTVAGVLICFCPKDRIAGLQHAEMAHVAKRAPS